jgi:hypothetical protein
MYTHTATIVQGSQHAWQHFGNSRECPIDQADAVINELKLDMMNKD